MGGLWGTVCNSNNDWGPEEANVACKQLGFGDKGKNFSDMSIDIWAMYTMHPFQSVVL